MFDVQRSKKFSTIAVAPNVLTKVRVAFDENNTYNNIYLFILTNVSNIE